MPRQRGQPLPVVHTTHLGAATGTSHEDRVVPDDARGVAIALHEHHLSRAARKGLEADSPAAGEQVEEAAATHSRRQHVE